MDSPLTMSDADRTNEAIRDRFLQRLYAQENARQAAYLIANDGRSLLGCERISVLLPTAKHLRLVAVSGVDVVDRRSQFVRAAEALAEAVIAADEDVDHPVPPDAAPLPPQVEQRLDRYLDQSPARRIKLMVLRDTRAPRALATSEGLSTSVPARAAPIALLLLEDFHHAAHTSLASQQRDRLRPHLTLALGRLLRQESLPLYRLGCWLDRRWQSVRFARTGIAILLGTLLMVAPLIVPVDFTVNARGTLQPARQHDLFASSDAIVRELHVEHGQRVLEGQVLLTLEDPELELLGSEISGQLRTAQQQLQTIRAQRVNPDTSDRSASDDLQLATQQQQLQVQIAGLEQQQQIVAHRRDALIIRSPLAGTVLTWDVQRQLLNRPVARGRRLLTVAQQDGEWQLDLFVPDRDISHVLQTIAAQAEPPVIDFLIATDASQTFRADLDDVSLVTESGERQAVRVTANLAANQAIERRAGATVVAKIHCGRRSLAYVWGRSLYDRIRTWWF